jgi:hypothetical protein
MAYQVTGEESDQHVRDPPRLRVLRKAYHQAAERSRRPSLGVVGGHLVRVA